MNVYYDRLLWYMGRGLILDTRVRDDYLYGPYTIFVLHPPGYSMFTLEVDSRDVVMAVQDGLVEEENLLFQPSFRLTEKGEQYVANQKGSYTL